MREYQTQLAIAILQLLFFSVGSPFPPSEQNMGTEKLESLVHFWLGGLIAEALHANCSLSCATGPSPFAPDTDSGKADDMRKWCSFLNTVY